jgi:hypothetical protein
LQNCEHYQKQIDRNQYFQKYQVFVYFHRPLHKQEHHLLALLIGDVPSHVVNNCLNRESIIGTASDVPHFENDREP